MLEKLTLVSDSQSNGPWLPPPPRRFKYHKQVLLTGNQRRLILREGVLYQH